PAPCICPWGHQRSEVSLVMNETTKKKVVARNRRVAGPLGGGSRMIEADRTSVDILLQLASAQALGHAGTVVLRLLHEPRRSGVSAAGTPTPTEPKQRIGELTDAFAGYSGLGTRMHDAS